MKPSARLALTLALSSLFTVSLRAQLPATPANSSISGKVICGDTNGPARFAKVLFKAVDPGNTNDFAARMQKSMEQIAAASAKSGKTPAPTAEEAAEQKRELAAASHGMSQVGDMLSASTVGLNGDYALTGLKPGTYYVHASMPGYIDPLTEFTDEELASADPQVRARIAAKVPTVTLTGTDSTRVDLRLERGASVSGKVLYDDGTPASGWTISAVHPSSDPVEDATDAAMSQALAMGGQTTTTARTDDLGNFRIAGLPAGTYTLRAGLIAMSPGITVSNAREGGSGINLTVYSGDTFRRTEAKTFTLTAGDVRAGADINVPQHKLHNITGHVSAEADAHSLNSGNVVITTKDDPGVHLSAAIHDDGSFRFDDLPSGSYTVRVSGGADSRTTGVSKMMGMTIPKREILHMYALGSTDVVLSDVDLTGIDFSLAQLDWKPPVHKPGEDAADPAADLGKIMGSLFSDDDEKPADKPATKP